VRHAVHEEGHVEGPGEAHVEVDPEGHPEVLVPEVPGHRHRQDDGAEGEQRDVVLPLEHADCIRLQIRHVDDLPLGHDLGVGGQEEPAHVGEEEATFRIMRIRIGLRELVVYPMIQGPRVGISLWAFDRSVKYNLKLIIFMMY